MNSSTSGINIQYPWSQLLVNGEKVIETRSYPIPEKFIGKPLAIIQTPGKFKNEVEKTMIIGLIYFKHSKQYRSKKEWLSDYKNHLVKKDDPLYGWSKTKEKWGWVVEKVIKISPPISPPKKRGIMYVNNCIIPEKYLK